MASPAPPNLKTACSFEHLNINRSRLGVPPTPGPKTPRGPHLCRTMGVGRVFSGAHCTDRGEEKLKSRAQLPPGGPTGSDRGEGGVSAGAQPGRGKGRGSRSPERLSRPRPAPLSPPRASRCSRRGRKPLQQLAL